MKNPFIARLLFVLVLAIVPFAAYADPNFGNLEALLIGLILIFLIVFLVALIASIIYFRKGIKVAFYIALIVGLSLYILCSGVTPMTYSSSVGLVALVPVLPLGILCCRPIRLKSTAILPYAGMTLVTTSALNLIASTFPNEALHYQGMPILSLIFTLGTICLFTWLLVKALLRTGNMPPGDIFKKANLMTLLVVGINIVTALLWMWIMYRYRGMVNGHLNMGFMLQWILPLFIGTNVTTMLSLRRLRNPTDDDFAGPPL